MKTKQRIEITAFRRQVSIHSGEHRQPECPEAAGNDESPRDHNDLIRLTARTLTTAGSPTAGLIQAQEVAVEGHALIETDTDKDSRAGPTSPRSGLGRLSLQMRRVGTWWQRCRHRASVFAASLKSIRREFFRY